MSNQCPNQYTEETFMESFGGKEDDLKKCNNCPNMTYEEGTMTCMLFNKDDIKE